jgi:hypothetical protein
MEKDYCSQRNACESKIEQGGRRDFTFGGGKKKGGKFMLLQDLRGLKWAETTG